MLFHRVGVGQYRHPLVGELTLSYEDLELPRDPGLTILVFTAEPGSAWEAALKRLATRTSISKAAAGSDVNDR